MCGICGIIGLEPKDFPATATQDLDRMLSRLSHRGPQGSGVHRSGAALFGAQRLAIRGLDDGQQPLFDPDSGVMAICNGEIDNHAALRILLAQRGRPVMQETDVAVIPGLYLEYGERFAEKLEGAFAIALWDPRVGKLILARDGAGERPLFYKRTGGTVAFATEIAALAALSPESLTIDRAAITGYLRTGCFVAPASPYRDIEKLGPGEIAVFAAAAIGLSRYWRWPVVDTKKQTGQIDEFDGIFRGSLLRQSDVDVDFGIFLSGGLDSSLIAAVLRAARPERKPPCYTLRFSEDTYDEGRYAERVASHCGLDIVSVPVDPGMFASELPSLIALTGEPLADPAWIPTAMLARRAAQDVRIVFGGEGGDELFGGYPTYPGAGLARHYDRLPLFIRHSVKGAIAALPPSDRKMPLSYLLKRFVEGEGLTPLERHKRWNAPVGPAAMRALGVADPAAEVMQKGDMLDYLQRHDLETTLAEGLLTKADRGGMSASLEIRAPYLDRAVMEFAATLPIRDRVRGLQTKTFLKRYATRYLPSDIVYRQKRGLSIPLANWLRGPLRDWAMNKLAGGRLAMTGLDGTGAEKLFAEHMARKADHAKALWALLVLDEWLAWHQAAANAAADRSHAA